MSAGPAVGTLHDDHVEVEDVGAANRLYNKGFTGTPQAGNRLRLSLVEAAHALEMRRLRIDGHDLASLLGHGAREGDRVEVHFLAYRDLRARGLVVRHDGDGYLVWDRGQTPKDAPWLRLHVHSERTPLRVGDLQAACGDVIAVVDEDGGVTYYRSEVAHPHGDVPLQDLPPSDAALLDDRVLVTDADAAARLRQEHVGTPQGEGLVLSLTEAEALRRRGALRVPDGLAAHAGQRQHHFPRTLPVYEALRAAGVVAKSGFRFGTHLRGYERDPDAVHAAWLFHCAFPDDVLHWSEVSRAVRLAHGVRKSFCIAVAGDPVAFIGLSWFRP